MAPPGHAQKMKPLSCAAIETSTLAMRDKNKPVVCELFAGVGGLSLGAVRAGFHLQSAFDRDERALAAHHRNFPNTRAQNNDVCQLTGRQLLKLSGLKPGQLTGLIGGPPCQGFSVIGQRNSYDRRNSLFSHFFRLVTETKPDFFLAENVMGILESRNYRRIQSALSIVRDSYVVSGPYPLTASDFGAPTSRRRVFFIGIKKTLRKHEIAETTLTSLQTRHSTVVREALRGLPGHVDEDWKSNPWGLARCHEVAETAFMKKVLDDRPAGVGHRETLQLLDRGIVTGHQGTVHSDELQKRYDALAPGETDPISKSTRLVAGGFCPTLRAGTDAERGSFQAVRPIHHRHARVISPREAARLQGFPDWFAFDPTKWHSFRQIGNSVPPLLAEPILKAIAGLI